MNDMITWLRSFFGVYTPPTYTVTQYDAEGSIVSVASVIPDGAAGVDWQYIAGVIIFAIVVWVFFRTLGGLICRRS